MTTIPGAPFDLSLCDVCLALLIGDAAGIRSVIRERWALHKQAAAQQDKRPTGLRRKRRVGIEWVAWLDEGSGDGGS